MPTPRMTGRAWCLVGLVMGLVLAVSGCDAGGGDGVTAPSIDRSGTLPTPSVTEPSDTATAPTRPARTTATPPTSIEPATTDEPPTTRPPTTDEPPTTAEPPTTNEPPTSADEPTTSASTPSTAAEPAASESGGLGTLGWILLAVLVAGLVAAVLIWRSRRSSAWDTEAAALERDTRTTTGTRLPSVLTAETTGQRALSWPPLRTGLLDLVGRWDQLAERAPDDRRRARSGQLRGLLQELVAAVDAENEAMAAGRDWRLLRPRVDDAGRALSAALAGAPRQEPPAGGDPGQPPPSQW